MENYFLYANSAEDDAVLQDILRVHNQDHKLIHVRDGYAVLQYLENVAVNARFPSLIILELNLQKLSGLETLGLLKTDDLYRLIPVVVFAPVISSEDAEACKALGADVLIRPKEFNNWRQVVDCLCSYID